jgi:hypothetical protein
VHAAVGLLEGKVTQVEQVQVPTDVPHVEERQRVRDGRVAGEGERLRVAAR